VGGCAPFSASGPTGADGEGDPTSRTTFGVAASPPNDDTEDTGEPDRSPENPRGDDDPSSGDTGRDGGEGSVTDETDCLPSTGPDCLGCGVGASPTLAEVAGCTYFGASDPIIGGVCTGFVTDASRETGRIPEPCVTGGRPAARPPSTVDGRTARFAGAGSGIRAPAPRPELWPGRPTNEPSDPDRDTVLAAADSTPTAGGGCVDLADNDETLPLSDPAKVADLVSPAKVEEPDGGSEPGDPVSDVVPNSSGPSPLFGFNVLNPGAPVTDLPAPGLEPAGRHD
jgi:hypothetical protein